MTELLAAAGLILTVLLAYMQIQRTQAATIRAQEAHLRNQLKVDLYAKAAAVFHDSAQRVQNVNSHIRSALSTIKLIADGFPFTHLKTGQELSDANAEAARGLNNVLFMLEQYEMVFSRFGPFRREVSDSHGRLLDAFNKLWMKLALYVPLVDNATGNLVGPASRPSRQDLAELETLRDGHSSVCNDIMGYMIDLQIEAQNELLGDLFGRQLPPRAPGDPAVKVLTRAREHLTERPKGQVV
jgi:hypothetical protein